MLTLINGKIYTNNPAQPVVSALAIAHGKILLAGSNEAVSQAMGAAARVIDLEGQPVLPGLADAHLHFQKYALNLLKVDCETDTMQECLARVAEKASHTPEGQWILGHGWNQNTWGGQFGKASDLDQVAPNQSVYLTAKSLHAGWANSRALELAGINLNTPDPLDGIIQRDATGHPTGILLEGAMRIVAEKIPAPTHAQNIQAMEAAQKVLLSMGLTAIHDFDQRDSFIALQEMNLNEILHLRVTKTIPVELLEYAVKTGLRSGFGDDHLRIGMVKAFADGALGPHTAAMFAPYEDEPGNTGVLLLDAEEIFEFGKLAVENGLGLTIHAIGDRANHEVINALDTLRRLETAEKLPHYRHRIEHVQLLHPDDFPRLAQLDLIASMQPIHCTSDMDAADRYWGKRSQFGYSWRSLLDLNTKMAFGSDAPVESPNPFWGLHAAITRRRRNGYPGPEGWYPGERISRLEALAGFTTGAAYAAGMEFKIGKLQPGYYADLVVLEEDYFTCPEEMIHTLKPTRVMIEGQWQFEA